MDIQRGQRGAEGAEGAEVGRGGQRRAEVGRGGHSMEGPPREPGKATGFFLAGDLEAHSFGTVLK